MSSDSTFLYYKYVYLCYKKIEVNEIGYFTARNLKTVCLWSLNLN